MVQRLGSYSRVNGLHIHGGLNIAPGETSGLDVTVENGCFILGPIAYKVPNTALTLTDNATNYIYIKDGNVSAATSLPTGYTFVLYEVVTASGAISTYADFRGYIAIGDPASA